MHYCTSYYDLLFLDHLTITLLCTVLWSIICRLLIDRTIVRRIYIRLRLHNMCIVVMIYYKVNQITTAHLVRCSYGLPYSRYSRYFKDHTRKCIMIDDSTISRSYNDRTRSASWLTILLLVDRIMIAREAHHDRRLYY